MERNNIRQRVLEGLAAACARGRKGGRPHIMTADKLGYARLRMADSARTIPETCAEPGGIRPSRLYQYLHADGALQAAGQALLDSAAKGSDGS